MVLARVIGISSSAIVSKLLVDLGRLANPESRLILGIIVVEDVFLALYLAMLQPVLGDADGVADAVTQSGRAFGFLLALTVLARWGPHGRAHPRCDHVGTADPGARAPAAGRLRRDLLLAFGLSVDPGELAAVAGTVAAAVALTVVLNVVAGLLAARLHHLGRQPATNVALTVLSRGEFALVLASLALAAGLDDRLGPFIAGYVVVLAVIGPPAATHSERLSKLVPRRLVSGTDDAPDAGLPTGSDDQEVEPVPQAAQQRLR